MSASFDTIRKALGFNLRMMRVKRNLTQGQVAYVIRRGTSYISDIEQGKSSLRLDEWYVLVKVCGLTEKEINPYGNHFKLGNYVDGPMPRD